MSIPQEVARDLRMHYLQLLLWGIQIQQGRLEPKHAHLLRSFALDHIRRCQSLLAGAGVLPHRNRREWEAFQDAERTLVGFFDWAGRGQMPEQWEPLQTELYGNEKVGDTSTSSESSFPSVADTWMSGRPAPVLRLPICLPFAGNVTAPVSRSTRQANTSCTGFFSYSLGWPETPTRMVLPSDNRAVAM